MTLTNRAVDDGLATSVTMASLGTEAVADLHHAPGARVWASVKAVDLTVYER